MISASTRRRFAGKSFFKGFGVIDPAPFWRVG
jgi:hypothetical protein